MSDIHQLFGPNTGYLLEMYEAYLSDSTSVDASTQAYFQKYRAELETLRSTPEFSAPPASSPSAAPATKPAPQETDVTPTDEWIARVVGAARLRRMIREVGHTAAHIDPLGSEPPGDPDLELATHGITAHDLTLLPAHVIGGALAEGAANALEAVTQLRSVYCNTVGYETDHIQNAEEREWLYDSIETRKFFRIGTEKMIWLLERLTEVDTFERFLHKAFVGQKRFSIEGTDMMVPMLNVLVECAAKVGTQEVVLGMAHRGRLNVLAHVMGKPYEALMAGFKKLTPDEVKEFYAEPSDYSGDVKYHLGWERSHEDESGHQVRITLVPNPSHLEAVNPVVEGRARAAQDVRTLRGTPVQNAKYSLALLIHGDAAFPGQGVVAETLNLSRIPGYNTGGTIHIIANNQIGFTAEPFESRSTLYAGDLAKGFEIPIVHVNADDPIACLAVTLMAHEYREKFHKDFLIDLVGYRRYGHNEGDEPSFTQPQMYGIIEAHPRLRDLWAQKLIDRRIISQESADAIIAGVEERLQAARSLPAQPAMPGALQSARLKDQTTDTGVSKEVLLALNESLLTLPEGFTLHDRLERTIFQKRREGILKPHGIDWGHAEALAFASILADGTPIRLSGQDSERGTFGHRNAVLHDRLTGERHIPLQKIEQARASMGIYNSPLSENAVLGFEYGYSMHAPGVLVLWEAQFGDFVNGAQIIIDQFLVSGNAKWGQTPSLVLLLPHGYEGQGPEHSSARIERFLQLAATDNIRVANCTTAAQYFHLLRLQMARLESVPRPLIVFTPKSLLREPLAGSSLEDLTQGTFQPALDDDRARQEPEAVTRLVLCSGKVSVDLRKHPAYENNSAVAIVRLERIYPFPARQLRAIVDGYPNLQEVFWIQEEPRNMGAWRFVARPLKSPNAIDWKAEPRYVGRPYAASPAEGSTYQHSLEQERILSEALVGAPAPKRLGKTVSRAR
jgi:2-oxoglutarate dehydrogenase E1 component